MLAGVVALVLAAACDVTEHPEPTATPSAIAPFALTNPDGLVAHADPTALDWAAGCVADAGV